MNAEFYRSMILATAKGISTELLLKKLHHDLKIYFDKRTKESFEDIKFGCMLLSVKEATHGEKIEDINREMNMLDRFKKTFIDQDKNKLS